MSFKNVLFRFWMHTDCRVGYRYLDGESRLEAPVHHFELLGPGKGFWGRTQLDLGVHLLAQLQLP